VLCSSTVLVGQRSSLEGPHGPLLPRFQQQEAPAFLLARQQVLPGVLKQRSLLSLGAGPQASLLSTRNCAAPHL